MPRFCAVALLIVSGCGVPEEPGVDESDEAERRVIAANASPGAQALPDLAYLQSVSTACHRWLDPNGSDTAAGTSGAPWRSFGKALAALTAGEVACARPGKYYEDRNDTARSGRPDAPIVIRAANPADRPVIYVTSPGWGPPFSIAHGYWVIDGLVVDNQRRATSAVNITTAAHHVTVRNCELFNGAFGASLGIGGDDVLVERNRIHDNFRADGQDAHAIHVQPGSGAQRILVRSNVIYDNGGDGFQCEEFLPFDALSPQDITLEDNVIYTTPARYGQTENAVDIKACRRVTVRGGEYYGFRAKATAGKGGASFVVHIGAQRVLVEGNHFHHSGVGMQMGRDDSDTIDTVIRHNRFDDIDTTMGGGYALGIGRARDVDVYNNTFARIGRAAIRVGMDNSPARAGSTANVDVFNNVVFNCGQWLDASLTTASDLESDANLFFGGTGAKLPGGRTLDAWQRETGRDRASVIADPRFVNAAGGDYHTLAGSPARNSAIAVGSLPACSTGREYACRCGGAADKGWLESDCGGTPPPPPPPPPPVTTNPCLLGNGAPVKLAEGGAEAFGLAVWPGAGGYVYWTSSLDGAVRKVEKVSKTVSVLATSELGAWGVAVDTERVYWARFLPTAGSVRAAKKSGVDAVSLVPSFAAPYRLVVDEGATGDVFFTSRTAGGGVYRVGKSGGAAALLAGSQGEPSHLALAQGRVYFTAAADGAVRSVATGGGAVTTLASGQTGAFAVAVSATHVYFTAGSSVRRVPVGGGTVTDVATGLDKPHGVTTDATAVYWTVRGTRGARDGRIMRAPLAGGAATTLATGLAGPSDLGVDAEAIYWLDIDDGAVMCIAKP